jgi:PAS domain S-box-containing protein
MKEALRILVVEDSEDDALLMVHQIKKGGYDFEFERVESAEKMRFRLKEDKWDIIISDYKMPYFNGLEALAILKESCIDIPFILVSGTIGEDVAVEAMKAGAHDYIMKNNLQRLLPAVERELREAKLRAERRLMEQKQKLAEKALLESEERYRIVADFTYDWEYWISPEGLLLYISPSCQRITGYSPDEFKVNPELLSSIIHPDVRQMMTEHLRSPLDSENICQYEFRIISRNNQEYWIEHICQPVFSSDGHFLGRRASNRDITERKFSETIIERNEMKFRTLFENANDAIFLMKEDTFIDFNHKAEQMFQCSRDEILNRHPYELSPPFQPDGINSKEKALEKINVALSGVPQSFEWKHIRLNGTPFDAEVSLNSIYINDQIMLQAIVRDITERKQAEEEIRLKNEQLLKLNAEKDKFFSIISHDLLNPFNSFLGLTQIMAEELPSLTMAEVQEIAATMSKSATNLYRLLENLLQWSRMQQGLIPFNPEVLHLLSVVNESIEMILEPAKSKGIELIRNIPDKLVVIADNNFLQTVIRNLVSNAIKFTPKGGKIIILAKATRGKNVEISIKDSGIGMNHSMVDNLFRLDIKTNRKGTNGEPGSGLGLLLCKEFVEKLGGKIWVESEEGKGSEFKFTLPVGN